VIRSRFTIGALVLALTASLAAPCLAAVPTQPKEEPCTMAGHADHAGAFAEACCMADDAQRHDREAQPVGRVVLAQKAKALAATPVATPLFQLADLSIFVVDSHSPLRSDSPPAHARPLRN